MDSAAAATVQPESISSQSRRRPSGVKGALRCIEASEVVWLPASSTLISEAHHIADPVNNVRGQNT
jgi:hypothetical protein